MSASALPPERPGLSTQEYIFLREEIRHEDNLINQRLSWLVSSQAFLLTGFAITLNGPVHFRSDTYERLSHTLVQWLPIAGVLICLINYLTIWAAILHMNKVRQLARDAHPKHFPQVQGSSLTRKLGLSGPKLIPLVFLLVWFVLLLQG
jgi:uncharacterized membrane protein YidH (DUF202 family)